MLQFYVSEHSTKIGPKSTSWMSGQTIADMISTKTITRAYSDAGNRHLVLIFSDNSHLDIMPTPSGLNTDITYHLPPRRQPSKP